MTLTEYLNIVKCDEEHIPKPDESKMTKEYMEAFEDRFKQNQAKRLASKKTADIKEFVNG
jgi:hypothetical protein